MEIEFVDVEAIIRQDIREQFGRGIKADMIAQGVDPMVADYYGELGAEMFMQEMGLNPPSEPPASQETSYG